MRETNHRSTEVLSLSGGVDSMAHLALLWLLRDAGRLADFAALHLRHSNRPEAQEEERWVAAVCAALGVRAHSSALPASAGRSIQTGSLSGCCSCSKVRPCQYALRVMFFYASRRLLACSALRRRGIDAFFETMFSSPRSPWARGSCISTKTSLSLARNQLAIRSDTLKIAKFQCAVGMYKFTYVYIYS